MQLVDKGKQSEVIFCFVSICGCCHFDVISICFLSLPHVIVQNGNWQLCFPTSVVLHELSSLTTSRVLTLTASDGPSVLWHETMCVADSNMWLLKGNHNVWIIRLFWHHLRWLAWCLWQRATISRTLDERDLLVGITKEKNSHQVSIC